MHKKEVLLVTYYAEKYSGLVTQELLPLDYGPSRRMKSSENRYHFYSVRGTESHPVSLTPDKIVKLEQIHKKFDPSEIVYWRPKWHIVRDWGIFS